MIRVRTQPSNKASAKLMAIVENKGGQLLSPYVSTFEHVQLRCANGHNFEKTPNQIISGKIWCKDCPSTRELEFQNKFAIALQKKNGILIDQYVNYYTTISIRCSQNHIFKAKPSSITYTAFWCDTCDDIHNISFKDRVLETITLRGGIVLSSSRDSNRKLLLKIECSNKHTFTMTHGNIKRGFWCLDCSRSNVLN